MARASSNGNDDKKYRISLTIDPSLRMKIRLAAAINDEDQGEWCSRILETYADKAVSDSQLKAISRRANA
jgi:hypothetical protein